jgi:hypothetical protein
VGYYTRVLSQDPECLPLERIEAALRAEFPTAILELEAGEPASWTELLLSHADGTEIAVIERNAVGDHTLGQDEIQEFIESLESARPASAVPWLKDFLDGVSNIYAFQHLHGTTVNRGDEIIRCISNYVWGSRKAIVQADGEGFTNEDGHHIIWDFSDGVAGSWLMAVRVDGRWASFQMDLANRDHREAFLAGRVPAGLAFK